MGLLGRRISIKVETQDFASHKGKCIKCMGIEYTRNGDGLLVRRKILRLYFRKDAARQSKNQKTRLFWFWYCTRLSLYL